MAINSLDLRMLSEVERMVEDRQAQLTANLVSGIACDYADYKFRVGQYKALSDVLAWAKAANREILGLPEEVAE